MDLMNLNNTQTMSSSEISKLTGKSKHHINRDIKMQFSELYGYNKDDPNLDDKLKQHLIIDFDERGYVVDYHLNQEQALTLVTGYSVVMRNKVVKRWQELESDAKDYQPQTVINNYGTSINLISCSDGAYKQYASSVGRSMHGLKAIKKQRKEELQALRDYAIKELDLF